MAAKIPDRDPDKMSAAETVRAPETTSPVQETGGDDCRPRSTNPRILLVEDNPFNRRVGSVMLERFGCEVVVAEDDGAIARYREGEFDLVLMDVQLPGMDGLEATTLIRAIQVERGRDVPIVALTAEASNNTRRRCLEAGMDGCLKKPMAEADLRRLVAETSRGDCPVIGPSATPWGLDPRSIRASYPMSDEAMANVIGLFRESCVERTRQMAEALDRGNATLLATAAHALRGSLAMFAASNTLELVASLEQLGKDGKLVGARVILGRFEMAIKALQPTLDHLLPVPC